MFLISLAANHCLTAQARISSGATTVQNNIFILAQNPCQVRFSGGTFGWTEVHAQSTMVKIQPQVTSKSVLWGRGEELKTQGLSLSKAVSFNETGRA